MPIYETDPSMRYATEEVWFAASLYVADWEQDFHELMLNDHIRMVAYENAIKRLVQPGMTVVDVGTGTGILAQWALEAGARTVHAIDMNENMIAEARARLSHAGYSDGVRLHRALSYEVTLPERVDVVMSEILGNLGDNEGMTPILNDARARFLKEGGHMLPRRPVRFSCRCPPSMLTGKSRSTAAAVCRAATISALCFDVSRSRTRSTSTTTPSSPRAHTWLLLPPPPASPSMVTTETTTPASCCSPFGRTAC
jgi:2-polyprenyl-3-methyl-5-hydroxy-6-metoxy-1,4-benzoquinol methylase